MGMSDYMIIRFPLMFICILWSEKAGEREIIRKKGREAKQRMIIVFLMRC
jgi:hypothetical protein